MSDLRQHSEGQCGQSLAVCAYSADQWRCDCLWGYADCYRELVTLPTAFDIHAQMRLNIIRHQHNTHEIVVRFW